ncbi:uncharacterized protein AB675_10125 [Cyphellophora attinorum]|uniref:Uncharacterized protein n=1 Tax=Cyphellophora attinorum TaxID=1664694 RepID=A0A0N1NWA2_9EURO|nr:uncharacterized protein AB675_10125 [Phialophora attinorum]KPI35212.1 hypothetical protein AB675_10125 [Phialophora attinorum]
MAPRTPEERSVAAKKAAAIRKANREAAAQRAALLGLAYDQFDLPLELEEDAWQTEFTGSVHGRVTEDELAEDCKTKVWPLAQQHALRHYFNRAKKACQQISLEGSEHWAHKAVRALAERREYACGGLHYSLYGGSEEESSARAEALRHFEATVQRYSEFRELYALEEQDAHYLSLEKGLKRWRKMLRSIPRGWAAQLDTASSSASNVADDETPGDDGGTAAALNQSADFQGENAQLSMERNPLADSADETLQRSLRERHAQPAVGGNFDKSLDFGLGTRFPQNAHPQPSAARNLQKGAHGGRTVRKRSHLPSSPEHSGAERSGAGLSKGKGSAKVSRTASKPSPSFKTTGSRALKINKFTSAEEPPHRLGPSLLPGLYRLPNGAVVLLNAGVVVSVQGDKDFGHPRDLFKASLTGAAFITMQWRSTLSRSLSSSGLWEQEPGVFSSLRDEFSYSALLD